MPPSASALAHQQQRRGFWLSMLHQWHWISSALCLACMLLFAITGITLNHAAQIQARPAVLHKTANLPAPLLKQLARTTGGKALLPDAITGWIDRQFEVTVGGRPAEWSEDEVYLSMPGPGSDAWLSIDRSNGAVEYEHTDRGWIAYFNDLHKGRNTGPAWRWFIDLFAVACLVFCITGLLLLQLHAGQRSLTWPMVGLGLLLPLLIALLLIHG